MKKIVLSFFLSIIAIVANAQQEGMYSITQEIKAKPGQQATMVVNLKNTIKFSGIQMKIKLPDGVEVAYDEDDAALLSLNSSRAKGFSTGVTYNPTTRLYYIDISHESKGIEPSEGEIFSLTFNVGKNAQLGTQNIEFTACEFADMDLVSYDQDDFTVPFIIYDDFSVSATTANETMGSVKIEPSGDAVESGTSITATATPNDGYSFVNWTSGETEVSKDNPYTFELAAATALTANFKANQYPVVFVNDGKEVKNETIDFASVITAPENPTKEGYTFLGWYAGETKFEKGATVPVNGVTYTAKWQINQYTITFDTDGGSEIASITQDYNTAVTAPENPTKTGYTFSAWDKKIPATMPANDITLKAIWTINKYTITFDTDGGSEVAPINQDYNSEVTKPADPTKTGYTFSGWDKEIPATMPAENITVKAQWTINQYTITFDTDGGSAIASITQDYNSDVTKPADPTKTGYTFTGWDKEIPATMPAEDITVKAQWTINQYQVTFILDDEKLYSEKQDYGSKITIPKTGEKDNMHVVWDPEVDETVPAHDVTYKGTWVPNNRKITFKFGNGEADYSYVLEYGKELTYPKDPVKEGHTFNGWSSDVEDPANSQKDVTFTAQWKAIFYTITFVIDGDVEQEVIYAAYGSKLEIPEATKEGYTFNGWKCTSNPEITEVPATIPAKNLTFVALWEINQYTITFDTDGGSAVASITQDYASDITAPAAPTKKGYTFIGWTPALPETMPAENMTLKANWQINKYTVTFKIAGKVFQTQTLEYGAEIVAPEPKVLEGRTFEYWNPTVDATVPDHNVVYEAVYSFNKYTITYYVNDVIVNTVVVRYGDIIENYVPTLDDGMTFDGWTDEIPQTMPAHDLEIHGTASNTSTAIKNIMTSIEEGCNVYTDNGVLVKRVNSKAELSTLPTGKYIINGVKIVIKK